MERTTRSKRKELQSMIQTHRLWEPLHQTTEEGPDRVKTYYVVLDGEELRAWQDSGKKVMEISEWKQVLTRVYQHCHLFELPQQARNYMVSLVAAAMSTTTIPVNESLHLVAMNLYPHVVLQRNLLHTYKRSGGGYLELENHSDELRNMDGFNTPMVIITGCNYNYIAQMWTPRYFGNHLVDTTVIHGDLHAEVSLLRYLLNRGTTNERVTTFIQKVRPDYLYLLDEDTTGETACKTTASFSKKKGVRSTTITADYDMEIAVKHVKRV